MDFGIISAFFEALVWWQAIIIFIIGSITVGTLLDKQGTIPFILILIVLMIDWTGKGAIVTFDSIFQMWLWILAYFIIGFIWSFFKWGELVKYYIGICDDDERCIRNRLYDFSSDNIAFWVIWWPISMLGFIFDDFITWLVKKFKGVYKLIADKIIYNALKEKKIKSNDD